VLDLVEQGVQLGGGAAAGKVARDRFQRGDAVGVDARSRHLDDLGAEDPMPGRGRDDVGQCDLGLQLVDAEGGSDLVHGLQDPV